MPADPATSTPPAPAVAPTPDPAPTPPAPSEPADAVARLETQLSTLRAELARADRAIALLERRRALEDAARLAGARDIPAAATLAERLLPPGDPPADPAERTLRVDRAMADLRASSPRLFAPAEPAPLLPPTADEPDRIADLAARGDRAGVLAFMRARRQRTAQAG